MERRRLVGNRYELGEVLGYGGMGTVFSGVDTYSGHIVALKQLDSQLVISHPDVIERFEREAETLRILDHPNIIKVLASFSDVDAVSGAVMRYIVMDYASGGSLRDLLDREERLELASFLDIGLDLADALTRAHRLKIIHRDIKPANVLLADDGIPRLTDFGIARISDTRQDQSHRLTQAGMMLGTVDYLSPEACMGEDLDARADIWAFGVMLFEMLAGRRPFSGVNVATTISAILTQPVPDIETLRPNLPMALIDLIYRMLEKDREARIPSVRIVGAELEQLMEGKDESVSVALRSTTGAQRFMTPTPYPSTVSFRNLPAQTTPFVGREAELMELSRLFSDPHNRLLTIFGPGGMGKTRLALEAATAQLGNYKRGAIFVPLAQLESAQDIVPAVAEAAGFQFHEGGEPEQQLLDYFQQKRLLLLIDNFEHLLDGVGFVGKLLNFAPQVRVLVTSREKLNLQEEVCYRLEGMDFPEHEVNSDGSAQADIFEYSAIKLFLQSARRANPGYEIKDDDLQNVVHICRQVNGNPLAIMLAAAWVELLSLPEIVREIEQNLDFLTSDLRDVPARQRSIRAVFASSWNQLSEAEQKIFMALSIFRGGFGREAAEVVAGANLRTLLVLANKSLLRRNPTSARYAIHELLRQYAGEQLEAAQMVKRIRSAHCTYFSGFMQQRLQAMLGPAQVKALDEIEVEYENVRQAWIWAVDNKNITAIDQAAESLFVFSDMRSREHEGEKLLRLAHESLAPSLGEEPCPEWGRLLLPWFDILLQSKGRPENVREIKAEAEAGLKFAEEQSNSLWIAYNLIMLGHFVEADEAIEMYERALTLLPRLDDSFWVRIRIGFCQRQLGHYQLAIDAFQQSFERGRANGEKEKMGWSLFNLGQTENQIGNYNNAESRMLLARPLFQQVGTVSGVIWTGIDLGWMALFKGDIDEARSRFDEALDIANESIHSLPSKRHILEGLGYLALVQGNYRKCRQIFDEVSLGFVPSVEISLGLVFTAYGLGKVELARQRLKELLRQAVPYRFLAMAYLVLPAAALILANEGDKLTAVELLALAFEHPQGPKGLLDKWPLITRLRTELRERLTQKAFDTAWERGQALDLTESFTKLADHYHFERAGRNCRSEQQ